MSDDKKHKVTKKKRRLLDKSNIGKSIDSRIDKGVENLSSRAVSSVKEAKKADDRAISKSVDSSDSVKKVKLSEANKLSQAMSKADERYKKASFAAFGVFSEKYYPDPPEPDFENIVVFKDEDEDIRGISVVPKRVGNNRFVYFDSPKARALMARVILFLVIAFIFFVAVETRTHVPGMIGAMILVIIVSFLLGLRQSGLGLFNRPVTLPAWMLMTSVDEYGDNIHEEIKRDDQGDVIDVEISSKNEEIDGVKSPGMYLAHWMSHYNITRQEFAQRSDLEVYTVNRVINDDERVWTDPDIVQKISQVTSASAERWNETLRRWNEVASMEDDK